MTSEMRTRAIELDRSDPLASYRDEFLPLDENTVTAYLDGNSLGRPLRATKTAMDRLIEQQWAGRLIQGWTDEWMGWPELVGDEIGAACLGAASGQTVVADSTTVLLYKLCRAAIALRPNRTQIVIDRDNFPTDRYVVEGIAAECDMQIRWIDTDPAEGVHVEQVRTVVGEQTALVVLSHIAYRSGWLADAHAITRAVHDVGGLILWDLCHSAGAVPVALDDWDADFAVGCSYKYLNGGPGAPAFAYVTQRLHDSARQPIQGWMGRTDPFTMGPGYEPAAGIRSFVSGTPPILAMVPVRAGVEQIARAGIQAIRTKSIALTQFAIELLDALPAEYKVRLSSPRDPDRRGGHVTISRHDFRAVNERLWQRGTVPDYRAPDGIRLGLSPLSTSFTELLRAFEVLRETLA